MVSAGFIKSMESLSVRRLPLGSKWTYEIKLDGFRVEAIRTERVTLYSRRGNQMPFPAIAKELESLPPGTIIDGELTALDKNARPSFNLLQNYRSGAARLMFFTFDILAYKGRDLMRLPLSERRSLLQRAVQRTQSVEIAE
jgi:ATP-dependent DNA ligase